MLIDLDKVKPPLLDMLWKFINKDLQLLDGTQLLLMDITLKKYKKLSLTQDNVKINQQWLLLKPIKVNIWKVLKIKMINTVNQWLEKLKESVLPLIKWSKIKTLILIQLYQLLTSKNQKPLNFLLENSHIKSVTLLLLEKLMEMDLKD